MLMRAAFNPQTIKRAKWKKEVKSITVPMKTSSCQEEGCSSVNPGAFHFPRWGNSEGILNDMRYERFITFILDLGLSRRDIVQARQ